MLTKVCGLTNTNEVEYLKVNNVDFAGIVMFYEKSKRNISIDKAKEIVSTIHASSNIKAVAVVVAPTKEQVEQIEAAGFDYIQIHGTIDDEIYKSCGISVLKAFNVDDLENYNYYLSIPNIKGFVFDAGQPGSGKTFDWDMLKSLDRNKEKLYILAGGLNAQNVIDAIETVKPDGVDVSSGVEFTDKLGKDPEKINEFIGKVRSIS